MYPVEMGLEFASIYLRMIEADLNKLIKLEMQVSFIYQQLANQFNNHNCTLPVFEQSFSRFSQEERHNVDQLIAFLQDRGLNVVLDDIYPKVSANNKLEIALQLERNINETISSLYSSASQHHDTELVDFIETQLSQDTSQLDSSLVRLLDYVNTLEQQFDECLL